MDKRKAVMLLSGGMDSTTLLWLLREIGYEIYPIIAEYGQRHSVETECAWAQAERAGVTHNTLSVTMGSYADIVARASHLTNLEVNVPDLDPNEERDGPAPTPPTYVPFRNMALLTLALTYAETVEAGSVFYGAQAHDLYNGYWDCSVEFVEKMNAVAALNLNNPITIYAPFAEKSKAEIVAMGEYLGVDWSATWSSYVVVDEEQRIAGAANPTSQERIRAFATAGVADPQKYDTAPDWDQLIETHGEFIDGEALVGDIIDAHLRGRVY